jgi:hypothetical protein
MKQYLLEIKYGCIACGLLLLLVLLGQIDFSALAQSDTMQQVISLIEILGLPGIYLLALLSNLSLVIPIPYTTLLLSHALKGDPLLIMMLLGLTSGLGAGTGKIIIYRLADRVLPDTPPDNPLTNWFQDFLDRNSNHTQFIIFLLMTLPTPDELVIIPLTLVHYPLRKVWYLLLAGKAVHNIVTAVIFYFFAELISGGVTTSPHILIIIFLMMGVALLYQLEKAQTPQPV